jgi:predicted ArsR family transcriptional regulator
MSQIALPYDTASKTTQGPSNAAGDRLRPKSPTLRELALVVLKRHPAGLTADEIAERLGKSVLTIRPRVTELGAAGAITDTGARRVNASGATATVWRLT